MPAEARARRKRRDNTRERRGPRFFRFFVELVVALAQFPILLDEPINFIKTPPLLPPPHPLTRSPAHRTDVILVI
jgi:hypothetical protein